MVVISAVLNEKERLVREQRLYSGSGALYRSQTITEYDQHALTSINYTFSVLILLYQYVMILSGTRNLLYIPQLISLSFYYMSYLAYVIGYYIMHVVVYMDILLSSTLIVSLFHIVFLECNHPMC
jgi:hypothetical protein